MTKQEVLDLLKTRGIELEIAACGCCSSPYVRIVVDGAEIVNEDYYNISQASIESDIKSAERLAKLIEEGNKL